MDKVPKFIQTDLSKYILSKCFHAEAGWEFSNQDEDTITGDFLGNLRTAGWIEKKNFEYRFYYNKIRGRGPKALEKKIGSDGIITIEIVDGASTFYKSFVFQSKKTGNRVNNDQLAKMEKYFPSNHVIFKYTSNGYFVENYNGSDISICKFIAEIFLNCQIGIIGTYYDPKSNKFIVNDQSTEFDDMHELNINVKIK